MKILASNNIMNERKYLYFKVKVPTHLISGSADYRPEPSAINPVHRYPGDTIEKSRIAFQNGLMRYT